MWSLGGVSAAYGEATGVRPVYFVVGLLAMTIFAGAGCSTAAQEIAADDVDLHAGATVTFVQNWTGLNPLRSDAALGLRTATVDEWVAGQYATISWVHSERRETDASRAAREAAARAPIGETVDMPDPVYETVTTSGSVKTDALGNAERVTMPSYWPEGEYDVRGEGNSVVWLSRAQYDELVTTRSSHVALGLFDSTLQGLLNFGDNVEGALAKLQGNIATSDAQSNHDITKLTAEGDWGTYNLMVNGTLSSVRVVKAKSLFADYTILANAENPMVLKVAVKPLSLGLGMLSTLSLVNSLAGYHVTAITY